jgi:hypothetical protein
MATWYVNGTSGNDANSGASAVLAKKTLAAAYALMSNGDTLEAEGVFQATDGGLGMNNAVERVIRQRFGGLRAWIAGSVAVAAGAWTAHSGDAYKATVTVTSTDVRGVCVRFGDPAILDTFGRPRNMLQQASSLADCIATPNRWWHESNTLYVNLNGTNPATLTAFPLEWMRSGGMTTSTNAIGGQGCSRCVISGISFRNLHTQTGGTEPYSVLLSGEDNLIEYCESHNVGRHHFGYVDSNSTTGKNNRNVMRNCAMWGGGSSAIAGTQSVWYQAGAGGVNDGLAEDCVWHTYQLLDVAGVQFGSAAQDGAFTHTDGVSRVNSLTYRRCQFYHYLDQTQGTWANAGNTTTPNEADGWNPEAYPCRYYDCIFVDRRGVQRGLSMNSAYVRCVLDNTLYGPNGNWSNNFSAFAYLLTSDVVGHTLFQSTFLVADLTVTAGNNATMMYVHNHNSSRHIKLWFDHSALVNNNSGTTGTTVYMFQASHGSTGVSKIRARRSVFVTSVNGNRALFGNDSSAWADADLMFDGCWYFGPAASSSTLGYSQKAARNAQTEWAALIDTSAHAVFAINPGYALPQSPDKASPRPLDASPLAQTKVLPILADAPVGINRRRNSGHYGPWQFGEPVSPEDLGTGGRRIIPLFMDS